MRDSHAAMFVKVSERHSESIGLPMGVLTEPLCGRHKEFVKLELCLVSRLENRFVECGLWYSGHGATLDSLVVCELAALLHQPLQSRDACHRGESYRTLPHEGG
jgi:hypothetical protein